MINSVLDRLRLNLNLNKCKGDLYIYCTRELSIPISISLFSLLIDFFGRVDYLLKGGIA